MPKGTAIVEELERCIGKVLNGDEIEQLRNLLDKICGAAFKQVEERIFGKFPRSIDEIIPDKNRSHANFPNSSASLC